MDVQISRESNIPLRLQVGRQIALLIASGKLKPGESLPSIRALAHRLKIHYNTVSQAYQDVAAYHLVERRRGNRMVVPMRNRPPTGNARMDLDDLVNAAIDLAEFHGHSLQQLGQKIQDRINAKPPDRLLVATDEPGLRELISAELEQAIRWPVAQCRLTDLLRNPALAAGALVIGPPGNMRKVAPFLRKDRPPCPVTFNAAEAEVSRVRKLKDPSAIAVVSVSEIFLQTARGLLAPAIGERHVLREFLLPSDKPDKLSSFGLVFCDIIAHRQVKAKNLVQYRLLSDQFLKGLANLLRSDGSATCPSP